MHLTLPLLAAAMGKHISSGPRHPPPTRGHPPFPPSPLIGIPKFFRWLSERYPLLSQPIGINGAPPVDNLYLDMNGIIHSCTHGNDPCVKLTEEDMVLRIFNYLDKLFHIVKPQKLLFMAVDGACSPLL